MTVLWHFKNYYNNIKGDSPEELTKIFNQINSDDNNIVTIDELRTFVKNEIKKSITNGTYPNMMFGSGNGMSGHMMSGSGEGIPGDMMPVSGDGIPGDMMPVSGDSIPGDMMPVSGDMMPVSGDDIPNRI